MTLAAAGLAENGSAAVERASLLNLSKAWQKVLHLPIAHKLPIRLHLADPIAQKRNALLIHHRGDQRRHLSAPAARNTAVENGSIRIAGKNQHGVVDSKTVVLWPGAEDVHLLAGGREAQFHFGVAAAGIHVANRTIDMEIRARPPIESLAAIIRINQFIAFRLGESSSEDTNMLQRPQLVVTQIGRAN